MFSPRLVWTDGEDEMMDAVINSAKITNTFRCIDLHASAIHSFTEIPGLLGSDMAALFIRVLCAICILLHLIRARQATVIRQCKNSASTSSIRPYSLSSAPREVLHSQRKRRCFNCGRLACISAASSSSFSCFHTN